MANETLSERYPPGTRVVGLVEAIRPFGVYFRLPGKVFGLLKAADVPPAMRRRVEEQFPNAKRFDLRVERVDDDQRRVRVTLAAKDCDFGNVDF